jgi:hypothetical protein
LADALDTGPYGRLRRLSVASNGIGPREAARLVASAAGAGVEVLDLGRVRAAGALGATDNQIDEAAAAAIGAALANADHRLSHLVLTACGMRSKEALNLLHGLGEQDGAPVRTRFVLGKGIATTVRHRFAQLAPEVAEPEVPDDVAAIRSVYRISAPRNRRPRTASGP